MLAKFIYAFQYQQEYQKEIVSVSAIMIPPPINQKQSNKIVNQLGKKQNRKSSVVDLKDLRTYKIYRHYHQKFWQTYNQRFKEELKYRQQARKSHIFESEFNQSQISTIHKGPNSQKGSSDLGLFEEIQRQDMTSRLAKKIVNALHQFMSGSEIRQEKSIKKQEMNVVYASQIRKNTNSFEMKKQKPLLQEIVQKKEQIQVKNEQIQVKNAQTQYKKQVYEKMQIQEENEPIQEQIQEKKQQKNEQIQEKVQIQQKKQNKEKHSQKKQSSSESEQVEQAGKSFYEIIKNNSILQISQHALTELETSKLSASFQIQLQQHKKKSLKELGEPQILTNQAWSHEINAVSIIQQINDPPLQIKIQPQSKQIQHFQAKIEQYQEKPQYVQNKIEYLQTNPERFQAKLEKIQDQKQPQRFQMNQEQEVIVQQFQRQVIVANSEKISLKQEEQDSQKIQYQSEIMMQSKQENNYKSKQRKSHAYQSKIRSVVHSFLSVIDKSYEKCQFCLRKETDIQIELKKQVLLKEEVIKQLKIQIAKEKYQNLFLKEKMFQLASKIQSLNTQIQDLKKSNELHPQNDKKSVKSQKVAITNNIIQKEQKQQIFGQKNMYTFQQKNDDLQIQNDPQYDSGPSDEYSQGQNPNEDYNDEDDYGDDDDYGDEDDDGYE